MDSEENQVCVCVYTVYVCEWIGITVLPFCHNSFTRLISSSSVPASERSSPACVSATREKRNKNKRQCLFLHEK